MNEPVADERRRILDDADAGGHAGRGRRPVPSCAVADGPPPATASTERHRRGPRASFGLTTRVTRAAHRGRVHRRHDQHALDPVAGGNVPDARRRRDPGANAGPRFVRGGRRRSTGAWSPACHFSSRAPRPGATAPGRARARRRRRRRRRPGHGHDRGDRVRVRPAGRLARSRSWWPGAMRTRAATPATRDLPTCATRFGPPPRRAAGPGRGRDAAARSCRPTTPSRPTPTATPRSRH